MAIERKSYPLVQLKTDVDQPGIIEAIVSVFNNKDAGNEIVRPGFFEKSINRKLPKGVWAHDWKQPIAKTLEAKELHAGDPMLPPQLMALGGAYIKGQFNLETQRGREAYSDIKFGIVDEFSIGYAVLKDGKDQESGARELIEGDWKEWSPVLVGMNDQTALISIKSKDGSQKPAETKAWEETDNEIRYRVHNPDDFEQDSFKTITLQKSPKISAVIGKLTGEESTTIQSLRFPADAWTMADAKQWVSDHADELKTYTDYSLKGMLAEQMAQTTPSTWDVQSALWRVICKIAETAKTADVTGVVIDWRAKVTEAINEYPPTLIPLVIAQIEEFLNSSDDEFYLKDVTGSDRFESFEDAGTALEKFAQKMRSNHEIRLKEGRVLSASNRAKVQACMDKIMELHGELSDLMAMSEPKPKEGGKELDLIALRTQSARLRNHALRTLARIA